MADTLTIFFSIEHLTARFPNGFPFLIHQIFDQDGEIKSSKCVPSAMASPFTQATYKIKPVFQHQLANPDELIGYLVGINVPACTVGTDALVQNLVYLLSLLAKEFFKHYLLQRGVVPAAVRKISLKHAELKSVTLTYLFPFASYDEARTAHGWLREYAEGILNTPCQNKKGKPVSVVSAGGRMTVNINKERHTKISSSVNAGPPPMKNAIDAESAKHLRVDVERQSSWLVASNLSDPLRWKDSAVALAADQGGLEYVRQILRLADHLRPRVPKTQSVMKLTPTEQNIVKWHVAGNDYKDHPDLIGKSGQYQWRIKRHVETRLRIDMTIPWSIQSTKLHPELNQVLVWNEPYQAPAHLALYCFVSATAKQWLAQLRSLGQAPVTPTPPPSATPAQRPVSPQTLSAGLPGNQRGNSPLTVRQIGTRNGRRHGGRTIVARREPGCRSEV